MIIRKCTVCDLVATNEIELQLFTKDKRRKYGRGSTCTSCENKRKTKWKEENKELDVKIRRNCFHIKAYGVTTEEYAESMSTSDCCEICHSVSNLVYDHDHITMEFRGVLCRGCNSALGHLGDNKEGVAKALEYLNKRI